MRPVRICLVPEVSGVGGMVSFQHKFAAGLVSHGMEVCYNLADTPYDVVLVIGGTRQLGALWATRRRGVRIVQRLNGMNWVHRLRKPGGNRRTSLRHFLRAEYGNLILSIIRSRLAHSVVYQSEFSRNWWERVYGATPVTWSIVHNGVDLDQFTPHGPEAVPVDRYRLLLVEGNLMGGYEMGLEVAVQLASDLSTLIQSAHSRYPIMKVELMVVGRVSPEIQKNWTSRISQLRKPIAICWAGLLPHEGIPAIDRSAHLLYSADINAACPNSVIEALACGLPVVAFDTGALPELVLGDAGRLVEYGSDPWRLEPPRVSALVGASLEILEAQSRFRAAARSRAEAVFGLDQMVDGYLKALLDG